MSDEERMNPKDRLGLKKVPLHLVSPIGVIYEAMAMGDGASKYGPFNWREKQVIASIYVAACKRHIDAWFDGEELAPDSGLHHLGHAKACLGIILDAMETNSLKDDRPPPGAVGRLLEKFNKLISEKAANTAPLQVICPYHETPTALCELCVRANP